MKHVCSLTVSLVRIKPSKPSGFQPHFWCQALAQCFVWARLAHQSQLPWILYPLASLAQWPRHGQSKHSGQALPNSGCAGLQFRRIFYSMATVNLALRLGFDPSFHRAGCTPDTRDQQAKLARFYPHSWCQALVQCSGWARLALEYWLPWVLLSLGQPGLMAGTLTARVTPAFRPGFGPVLARLCWPVGPRYFSLNFLGQALTLAG